MTDALEIAIYFRIIERSVLIFAVLTACISIMIVMRKQSQRLDLQFDSPSGSAKFIATLYMPVFATLILVLIVFIAVSNPFTLEIETVAKSETSTDDIPKPRSASEGTQSVRMVGFGASEAENIRYIKAINNIECLALADANPPPPWCKGDVEGYIDSSQPLLSQLKTILIGLTFDTTTIGRCAPYKILQYSQKIPDDCQTYLEAETEILE